MSIFFLGDIFENERLESQKINPLKKEKHLTNELQMGMKELIYIYIIYIISIGLFHSSSTVIPIYFRSFIYLLFHP